MLVTKHFIARCSQLLHPPNVVNCASDRRTASWREIFAVGIQFNDSNEALDVSDEVRQLFRDLRKVRGGDVEGVGIGGTTRTCGRGLEFPEVFNKPRHESY